MGQTNSLDGPLVKVTRDPVSKRLNLKSAKPGANGPALTKSISVNNFLKPPAIETDVHRTLATPQRVYRDQSASNEKAYPMNGSVERPDTADQRSSNMGGTYANLNRNNSAVHIARDGSLESVKGKRVQSVSRNARAARTTTNTQDNLRGAYKGMTLSEVVQMYGKPQGAASQSEFSIQGYSMPKNTHPQKSLSMRYVLKYPQEDPKKSKSYINTIVNHAKGVPDPCKYSKVIKWTNDGRLNNGKFNKQAKITLFAQMSKDSKGKPGPGAYHADKSKDKAVLERVKFMGTYKSGNDKVSILEAESFAKKNIPGPQHKYKINDELVRTKTPFYVNF